jgi:NAD-dependent deacetylase
MDTYRLTSDNLLRYLDTLRTRVQQSRFPVAVTGAGISVASGVPLVGDTIDGVPLRQFFTPDMLRSDPAKYFDVYRTLLQRWRQARPNKGHYALAQAGTWVITQNIDGLHRDAGSRHVIELHGNLRELLCRGCAAIYPSQLAWRETIPRCARCGLSLEPGIVLEGQRVRHFSRAVDWVGRADLLMVIGTRLEMNPVRRLPEIARASGADVVWINADAERILPQLLARRTV